MPARTDADFWQLCQTDFDAALREAKTRSSAWGRCQDLAKVAWFAPTQRDFEKLIKETMKEALDQESPNRIVTVASWPVRAMAERKYGGLEQVVAQLLEIIEPEPHPVRKSDALLMLLEAVYKNKALRAQVLKPLLSACTNANYWKTQRTLRHAALVFAIDDMATAQMIIEQIQTPRIKRQAERYLAEGHWFGPHEFMPYYQKLGPNGKHLNEGI